MVRQAVRRRPAGLTLGCAPPGVWVLRGHPVAGNSAPGLPLFSVVFIGGCSGASIGKRDRKRPSQTRKSEHHGGCSASLNGGPCPFSLALFAAPARNRGAKKNPGPAPMPSSAGDCTPSRPRRRAERAPGQRRPAARSGPVAFFLVLTCGRRSPAPTRCRCWTCSAPGNPRPLRPAGHVGELGEHLADAGPLPLLDVPGAGQPRPLRPQHQSGRVGGTGRPR